MATQHLTGPGGIVYSPASAHSQEMARWETRPRDDGSVTQSMINAARAAGEHHGAFEFQEFPKAMYYAAQTPNGIKIDPVSGFMVVSSSVEQRNMESRGWRDSQEAALGRVESDNQAAAVAAANRAFNDRRMSAKAQAEAEILDNSTARHLGEIPTAPIKRRRRTKAEMAAAEKA